MEQDSNMFNINGIVDGLYPLNVSHASGEFKELLGGNIKQ